MNVAGLRIHYQGDTVPVIGGKADKLVRRIGKQRCPHLHSVSCISGFCHAPILPANLYDLVTEYRSSFSLITFRFDLLNPHPCDLAWRAGFHRKAHALNLEFRTGLGDFPRLMQNQSGNGIGFFIG